jgi:hypothetical protein
MNPNHLLKDELEYELRVRGIVGAGEVYLLRKQLRQAISSCYPALPEKFLTGDVREDFGICVQKLRDLEHYCNDADRSCPLVAARIKSRCLHLLARFQSLSKWETSVALPVLEKEVQGSISRLSELLTATGEVPGVFRSSGAYSGTLIEMEDGILPGPSNSQVVTRPNLTSSVGVSEAEVDKVEVTVWDPLHEIQACSGQTVAPTYPVTFPSPNTSLFAKLPHPMETLLCEIPVISWLEVEPLLQFLTKVLEMRDHFGLPDRQVFDIIYPRCLEPLRARVNFALSQRFTVDQFQGDVLEHLVPRCLFDNLKQELFGRLQRADESFTAYVTSLKQAARVLKLPLTQREVIDNIVDGLSPQQRSRFVFEARPVTWADIDRLCIHYCNMSFTDGIRLCESSERRKPVLQGHNSDTVGRGNRFQIVNVGSQGRGNRTPSNVTCFYCKKVGHVLRDYWKRQRNTASTGPVQLPSSGGRSEKRGACASLVVPRRIFANQTSNLSQVEAQVGPLHATGLLDSGSVRSVISCELYEHIKEMNPSLVIAPVSFTVLTASRQSLSALGEVSLKIKMAGFSWSFRFLVLPDLVVPLILDTDFFVKTGLILDMAGLCFYFRFSPETRILFLSVLSSDFSLQTAIQEKQQGIAGPDLIHLSGEQRRHLEEVVARFPDVLTNRLGLTHLLEYYIRLKDDKPVKSSPYRLAPPKITFLREHIKQLLEQGVIEPSSSQYSSPMFLVPKPDHSYRAVVDYRRLNQCIEIESVPLPDIHSAFHWFCKAKYFTTLDLNQAYHQIPIIRRI